MIDEVMYDLNPVDHLICLFETRLSDGQEVLACHACDLNGDSETGLVILRAEGDFFVKI